MLVEAVVFLIFVVSHRALLCFKRCSLGFHRFTPLLNAFHFPLKIRDNDMLVDGLSMLRTMLLEWQKTTYIALKVFEVLFCVQLCLERTELGTWRISNRLVICMQMLPYEYPLYAPFSVQRLKTMRVGETASCANCV